MSNLNGKHLNNLCRICLSSGKMRSLYDDYSTDICMAQMLMLCTPVKFHINDGLPTQICLNCVMEMQLSYNFALKCVKTNNNLQKYLLEHNEHKKYESKPDIKLKEEYPSWNNNKQFISIPIKPEYVHSSTAFQQMYPDLHKMWNETNSNSIPKIDSELNSLSNIKIKIENLGNSEEFIAPELNNLGDKLSKTCKISTIPISILVKDSKDDQVLYGNGNKRKDSKNVHLKMQHPNINEKSTEYSIKCEHLLKPDELPSNIKILTSSKLNPVVVLTQLDLNKYTENIGTYCHTSEINKAGYNCGICKKDFNSNNLLIEHKVIHATKEYTCSKCGLVFDAMKDLKIHINLHSDEKPYKCSDCQESFWLLKTLRTHQAIHSTKQQCQCTICNRKFKKSSHLMCHMRRHSDEKRYTCHECGLSFKYKQYFKDHVQMHSNEKSHICSDCGKSFGSTGKLTSHVRTHNVQRRI